ncbi:MAG: hypothetical protein FDZ69_07610 [Deltaproteobacteria bacterium]|nr:MAG: hypothetical protein FDZ69_07610 [Deltaproteobacteria bacterium]
MKSIFCAMVFVMLPLLASAGYVEDLRYTIADYDSRIKSMRAQLDMARPEDAEQLIHDIYYLRIDRFNAVEDLIKETATGDDLERKLRDLDLERADLDRKYQNALTAAQRSIKPKVNADSLSVMETKRSYGYVYYSVKVDIDNPGPAGKVYVSIKGKRYDGHELESVLLSGEVDENSKVTLTDSTMVKDSEALNISKWEVAEVSFYPR